MKKLIGIGFVTLLSIAFFSCGASKAKAQSEHPFKVLEATYANWVGEQPDLDGITVKITTNNPLIQLDSVYFRNHSVLLKREINAENSVFKGSFTVSKKPHDYILHRDSQQEFGNKPPILASKTHFELTENEAVMSYFYRGKINYYKILEMKEIELKD